MISNFDSVFVLNGVGYLSVSLCLSLSLSVSLYLPTLPSCLCMAGLLAAPAGLGRSCPVTGLGANGHGNAKVCLSVSLSLYLAVCILYLSVCQHLLLELSGFVLVFVLSSPLFLYPISAYFLCKL